jgi:hypothetical protein
MNARGARSRPDKEIGRFRSLCASSEKLPPEASSRRRHRPTVPPSRLRPREENTMAVLSLSRFSCSSPLASGRGISTCSHRRTYLSAHTLTSIGHRASKRRAAPDDARGMRLVVSAVAAPGDSFTAWDTAVQRVPKRTDIKTIMLLGAGPIVIGQVRRSRFDFVAARRFESMPYRVAWDTCIAGMRV